MIKIYRFCFSKGQGQGHNDLIFYTTPRHVCVCTKYVNCTIHTTMFQCMQNMKALGSKTKTFCTVHDDVYYTDRRHSETSRLCIPTPFSTACAKRWSGVVESSRLQIGVES